MVYQRYAIAPIILADVKRDSNLNILPKLSFLTVISWEDICWMPTNHRQCIHKNRGIYLKKNQHQYIWKLLNYLAGLRHCISPSLQTVLWLRRRYYKTDGVTLSSLELVSYCRFTPSKQLFNYILATANHISMIWWWCPFCTLTNMLSCISIVLVDWNNSM
jgi:cell division protein FtsL